MAAIEAANSDKPAEAKPKASRKKPGPAKRHDAEGKPILKGKQTKTADLRTEEDRAAELAALYADLDEEPEPEEVTEEEQKARAAAAARLRTAHPYWSEYEILAAVSVTPPVTITGGHQVPVAAPIEVLEVPTEEPGEIVREPHGVYLEILSEPFAGQEVIPAPADAPFGILPTLEARTYRLVGTNREYILQELVDDRWQEASRGFELGTVGFHFAFRKIQCPAFHEIAATLPRLRPGRQSELNHSAATNPQEQDRRERYFVADLEVPMRAVMAGAPNPPEVGGGNWLDR